MICIFIQCFALRRRRIFACFVLIHLILKHVYRYYCFIDSFSLSFSLFHLFAHTHAHSNIQYANKILAEAICIFRNGERKKLLVRGSNSTTRSYFVTGMEPCDPYSPGWTEALELYGSYNGLKTKGCDGDQSQFYGVRPKDNNVCPMFSERDLSLLDEAIPNLVSNDELTVLNHVKTKCYSVVEEIINKWVERFGDGQPRGGRPRAITDAEKVALEHMDITQIISVIPKQKG